MPKLPPTDHQKRFVVHGGEHLPLRGLQDQAQAWLLGQAGALRTPRQGAGGVTDAAELLRALCRAPVRFPGAAARKRQQRAPPSRSFASQSHPGRRRTCKDCRASGADEHCRGRGHGDRPVHRAGGVLMPDAGLMERGVEQ